MELGNPVGIIGMACRLPGAPDEEALWRVLAEGVCTVTGAPRGRWLAERFLHPRRTEPGYSYSFAGGYLDDPFGFDSRAFGISPREAAQIDPQQRLLLEVVWEALEDAGIAPSGLAGETVGVYVGASNVDYQGGVSVDPAAIESHFVTGISLSIASNRISHAFDWKGPSMTIDTACSSSIVALAQALDALARDEIDTAVVAGVNMLLSPAPFIGFSRAGMLSPTGLCRPFSAEGDGYVRAEGAVAVVIRKRDAALAAGDRIRSVLLGAGVNSDGRTVGISQPSVEGQRRLLDGLYDRLGLDPQRLAFLEAHGTGTRVGDPVEARAIGEALGRFRTTPLPVGSVKSNIGHLEPASGLAGLAKAVLSLEHGFYPRTLHLSKLNPDIPFEELGLRPAVKGVRLDTDGEPLFAGLCNYGFGGTNAHAVLRSATAEEAIGAPESGEHVPADVLVLTAHSADALPALAESYADLLEDEREDVDVVARAAAHQRDLLPSRLALPLKSREALVAELRAVARGQAVPGAASAAASSEAKLAFVYAGNGCQWAGMGLAALRRNAAFEREMQAVDAIFAPLGGWSLIEALHAPDLAARLSQTSVAQPLLFAIQSALTAVLAEAGVRPDLVIGHSVGEVAAAEASGALTREQAIGLIIERGRYQEKVHGLGGMVAVAANEEAVRDLLGAREAGVEVAAVNSPSSTTVSGCEHGLQALLAEARRRRLATVQLDVAYPFHSAMLDPHREDLIAGLAHIAPDAATTAFISSVTGAEIGGEELDADYWWRNIREPVLFQSAVVRATEAGATVFVEISPKATLAGAMTDTFRQADAGAEAVHTLSERDEGDEGDPIKGILTRLLVRGARMVPGILGSPPRRRLRLPHYPWQRQRYVLPRTGEGLNALGGISGEGWRHPLIGSRMADGSPEWRMTLDAEIVPYLGDHRVGNEAVVPGAALLEMALAVGRVLHGDVPLEVEAFDVAHALVLPESGMREISVRYSEPIRRVEIWSRARFAGDWTFHAGGRIGPAVGEPDAPLASPEAQETIENTSAEIYAAASRAGLNYGPMFRRVETLTRDEVTAEAALGPTRLDLGAFDDLHALDPTALDAAFHGLFISRPQKPGETKAHLPVRVRCLRLWRPGAQVARTIVRLTNESERSTTIDATLLDKSGAVVAEVRGVHLKAVILSRAAPEQRVFRTEFRLLDRGTGKPVALPQKAKTEPSEAWLLTRAFATSLAYREIAALARGGRVSIEEAIGNGTVAPEAGPLVGAALQLLAEAELATEAGPWWELAPDCPFPAPETLLAALADRFPAAQAELAVATAALTRLGGHIRTGEGTISRNLEELFESEADVFAPGLERLRGALEELAAAQSPRRPRVLFAEPWSAGALGILLKAARRGSIELTLAGAGRGGYAALAAREKALDGVSVIDLSAEGLPFSPLEAADALVLAAGAAPEALGELLAPDCLAAVLQPPADFALDLLLGMRPGWFSQTLDPNLPVGRYPPHEQTRASLSALGVDMEGTAAPVATAGLMLARRNVPRPETGLSAVKVTAGDAALAAAILARAAGDGEAITLIDLPGSDMRREIEIAAVRERLLRLAALLGDLSSRATPAPLWVVTRGAFGQAAEANPGADAVWSFMRVAVNEYPTLDIRLADISPDLEPEEAAERLLGLIRHPGAEAEVLIAKAGIRVPRILRGPEHADRKAGPDKRTLLRADPGSGADQVAWSIAERQPPAAGEVEVEIVATGLNFRDVMLAMGLLDEDILGAGLTGASLGFEFAGRVARLGESVEDLSAGDLVMGFGSQAFASHVTVPRRHVFLAPDGISAEAAATIPVAFSTAWFALREVARLREGERLLLHGAVGGVGMAALQIARSVGAEVIATAGSEERRELARVLGASAAYDSRSLDFAEAVRRDFGGVDVVLNSLSGEAMVASLKLLRPFGRFVEIGKRDYMENTAVGLRPFVRNLSYHGVDIDELLRHDPDAVETVMGKIAEGFAAGALTPLPHRIFDGDDVAAAFRVMQQSGHMGKILVRPSRTGAVAKASLQPFVPAPGAHVVLGGTSGFGLETARWLLEQGAERVVVASRRGSLDGQAQESLSGFGDRLSVEQVDVRDAASVGALMDRLREAYGRIAGVILTAMVLDDGLIEGLTLERLHAVLAPKLEGVAAADAATSQDELQYFVAYSSATTLIGSPGQGAYVAANAYLEGFVRRRRAAGAPGLAVAWGAISDVGVIARDSSLGNRLTHSTGVTGVPAAEALDHLGRLLAAGNEIEPVQIYTAMARSAAAAYLGILKTPAFAAIGRAGEPDGEGEAVDIADITAEMSEREALEQIVTLTRDEVARILWLPREEIDPRRPLVDIGMDSLMALELRLSIEKRCGVDLPLLSLGNKNIVDVARGMLTAVRGTNGAGEGEDVRAQLQDLAEMHSSVTEAVEVVAAAEVLERRARERLM